MLFKKTLLAALFAALAVTMPFAARADKTTDAKQAIQALYNKEIAAVKKKDVKAMFASNSSDYVYYNKKGEKVDTKALQSFVTQSMPLTSNIKARMKIVKFSLKGDQAVAVTEGHLEMTITPPPNTPQAGQPMKIVSDDQTEDTWKKVKGKWMRTQSRILKEKQTVNGKPAPGQ